MQIKTNYLFIFLTTLLLQHYCYGQKPDMVIRGRVLNAAGQGVPDVDIHLQDGHRKVETDSTGNYVLPVRFIAGRKYVLKFNKVGHIAAQQQVNISHHHSVNAGNLVLQELANSLEEVVVKDKSAIQAVRESAFNVVALDAKSSYNTTLDLAHMLNKASGVRIRETGGLGSDFNISLNGFTGRHVKVFMDGLPMQGFGSAFQLNNIPVTMAERIEVYKGVVPIEFGADALGGVINIVTNQSTNTSVDASYSYGSFNTHRANVNFNYTSKSGLSLQLNTIYNYSDNDYTVHGRVVNYATGAVPRTLVKVKRFNDKYENVSVVGKIGIVGKSWADRFFIGATVGKMDKGIQSANNFFTAYGEVSSSSKTFQPSLSYDKRNLLVKGLSVRLNANYNANSNSTLDTSSYRYNWLGEKYYSGRKGEIRFSNNNLPEFINRNGSSNMSVSYRLSAKHSIAVNDVYTYSIRKLNPAIDITQTDLSQSDSIRRVNIKNVLGLSYRYNHNKTWNLNAFGKHYLTRSTGPQDVSENNAETKYAERKESYPAWGYGIAATYFLKNIQLKTSLEKALRLPTDRELFGDELFEQGNLSLAPEKSYNLNLGFVMNKQLNTDNTLYVDVNAYYRHILDYIIRNVEDRYGVGFSMNHGKARNIGIDAEVRYYYKNKITLGTTVSFMDLRDKEIYVRGTGTALSGTYNKRMPNVPYFFGNFDAAYLVHNFLGKGNVLNLAYTLNFVNTFSQSPEDLGAEEKPVIPTQLYHDFIVTYNIKNARYNITLEALDFTNVRLYDNFALEKPGRSFNVKLRYFFMRRGK